MLVSGSREPLVDGGDDAVSLSIRCADVMEPARHRAKIAMELILHISSSAGEDRCDLLGAEQSLRCSLLVSERHDVAAHGVTHHQLVVLVPPEELRVDHGSSHGHHGAARLPAMQVLILTHRITLSLRTEFDSIFTLAQIIYFFNKMCYNLHVLSVACSYGVPEQLVIYKKPEVPACLASA